MSQIHLRNRLRQTVLLAISSALLLSLTGCSSLAARKNALRRRDSAPYIGVRQAFRNLDECAHPTFIKPLPLFGGCLFPIYVASGLIVVADLPFSLALDTILYPTDKLYGAGRIYGIKPHRVALVVHDEEGCPISDAYVRTTCHYGREGMTGSDGVFVNPNYFSDVVSAEVKKSGYYDSCGAVWIPVGNPMFPTNALAVQMRRIVNPVQLTYHKIHSAIPQMDVPVGFDLQIGDWVEPCGKGLTSDLLILSPGRDVARKEYSAQALLSVPNPHDGFSKYDAHASLDPCMSGIVGSSQVTTPWYSRDITRWMTSRFRAPHVAPVDGYSRSLRLYKQYGPGQVPKTSFQEMTGWIFRVRAKTNELGQVTSAHVGWTDNDISVGVERNDRVFISFNYYFNPDPTSRSLEPKEIADQQARGIPGRSK